MSRVIVNLRIYYQSVWMVVLWVIIGMICLPLITVPLFSPDRAEERGFFVTCLMVGYFLGYFVAVMLKETLVKPFTFCLPGHRYLPRRMLFVFGTTISVLLGLIFLRYPGLIAGRGWAAAGAAVWEATCLAMIFFLLAVVLAWRLPGGGAWAIPIIFTWRMWSDLERGLADRMGEHAVILTPVVIVAVWLVWHYLQPDRQARRLCGTSFLAPHESLNRTKVERYRRHAKLQQQRSALLDGLLSVLLLPLMRRLPGTSTIRYLWGECVAAASRLLVATTRSLVFYSLFMVVLIMGLGYHPIAVNDSWILSTNLIFLVPCIAGLAVIIPIFSTRLLPAGRRQRMWAGVSVGLLGALLSVGLAGIFHLISQAVEQWLPVLHIMGRDLVYEATDPRFIYLPLLILPVCYGFQLIFERWSTIPQTIVLIILACWMLFSAPGLRPEGPWTVASVLLVFWGAYFALVGYFCRGEDLVRQ